MKKIALTFLSLIMTAPAFGGVYYNSGWGDILRTHIPEDKYDAAAAVLKEIYDPTLGIEYRDLWKICAAAGFDVKTPDGEEKCQKLAHDLVYRNGNQVTSQAMHVCIDSVAENVRENGGEPICIRAFTNEYIGGTQVRLSEAIALAQEYLSVKYPNVPVACHTGEPREIPVGIGAFDYGITCISMNGHKYFEFIFDDIKESFDKTIQNSIQTAVCKGIYGVAAVTGGTKSVVRGGGPMASADTMSVPATCAADEQLCSRIDTTLWQFGYNAVYESRKAGDKEKKCYIDFNPITNKKKLRTAYGIDNFEFCKNIQVQNTPSVEDMLKNFIAQKSGASMSSIRCAVGTNTYTGGGCVNSATNLTDDVKTCYVNGTPIDFVFDDLSEFSKTYVKGGMQAMSCIVSGGTYSGQRCLGLGEAQCNILKKANLKSCPECAMVRWDTATQSCVLPSSQAARNLEKGINVSLIVGGAVVGVVITVATAGTAGAPMAAFILTGIETVGAGVELTSQLAIDGIADDFLVKSNQCKYASCAKNLVNQHLQRLARTMDDMTTAEITAIDSEMVRLIDLVPTTDDWWVKSLKTKDGKAFLESANDNMWEAEQVWRAIGIGLQATSVFTAVGKWIVTKTGVMVRKLDKTSQILLKNAKIAKANYVNTGKLSGADAEWYKLWQEYAPKNQTLNEFKAMTDGNLDEMKEMSKGWTSRSAAQAKRQAQEQLSKFDNVVDNVGNYSTFDPEMSRDFRQYNKAKKELDDWWKEEYNKELDRYVQNGGLKADFNDSEQVQQLVAQYAQKDEAVQKLKPSQWDVAEKYSLKNVDNVVNERAREFADVIDSNPGIKLQMDKWDDLTDVQRSSVAQQIMDAYSAKNGTPRVNVLLDYDTSAGGYYTPGTRNITLNPKAQLKSPEGMIEVLAHEHGHLIDSLVPNEGALGAQYSHYGEKVYSNKSEKGYRVALTEQSSYKIGPAASTEVTGTTNPRLGTEYHLEQAKASLE